MNALESTIQVAIKSILDRITSDRVPLTGSIDIAISAYSDDEVPITHVYSAELLERADHTWTIEEVRKVS